MVKRIMKFRVRRNEHQKNLVQDAIKATISKNGVIVSRATTVKEICEAANYNRSVELPICGTGKLRVY